MSTQAWTVIGYWNDEDEPVSVGVIAGEHQVMGGMDFTGYGEWATFNEAATAEEAEADGLEEMRATRRDDNEDNEDTK